MGASAAQAGDFCSGDPYWGVVDGDDFAVSPSQITIDGPCLIRDWTIDNPLTATLNFQTTAADAVYLITFDNVYYTGNIACSNVDHKLWFVNGSYYGSTNGCQDPFIPVEKIEKQGPTAVGIGVPFTYTLTIPVMYNPETGTVESDTGSYNALDDITLIDDLNALGVSYTLIGTPEVAWDDGSAVNHTYTNDNGKLTFHFPDTINAGRQIQIKITLVLDDTNALGTVFTNTATWEFSRSVDVDDNGIIEDGTADLDGDGIFEDEIFEPLTGENGIWTTTIAEPDLAVTKSGTTAVGAPSINLGEWGNFTVDIVNNSAIPAYNVTVDDILPRIFATSDAGMCEMTPQISSVTLAGNPLTEDTHYTWGYTGPDGTPACQLSVTLTDEAPPIGEGEHLIISYDTKLDPGSQNDTITNLAGATHWYNGSWSDTDRQEYNDPLGNGTVEAAHDTDVVVAGYWFEKTAENLTTGASPVYTSGDTPTLAAAAGNRLRYTIRFQATEVFTDFIIWDLLPVGASYVAGTLNGVPIGATVTSDPSTGVLEIQNLNFDPLTDTELSISFDVDLDPTLTAPTIVVNQAELRDNSGLLFVKSDDPFVNGQANPDLDGDEDPTRVAIDEPTVPVKAIFPPMSEAAIGETVTYQITVPGEPYMGPLNGVVVTDSLDSNLVFQSATAALVSGGALALTTQETGQLLTWNLGDISSGEQVVITVEAIVDNRTDVIAGDSFDNVASYTFVDGPGELTSTPTPVITVVEPSVTMLKEVSNVTDGKAIDAPAVGGDTLEYKLTLTNDGSGYARDVNVTDALPEGLVFTGIATASLNGSAVGSAPVVDGTTNTLIWGRANGDEALDIPPGGGVLELTFQVTVQEIVAGGVIDNKAWADWTSLDGAYPIDANNPLPGRERTGLGCPNVAAPNVYCTEASVLFNTVDTNAIEKVVVEDTYTADTSTNPNVVRPGDIITYELRLNLREGDTYNVSVTDELDPGLAFVDIVSINGDVDAPYISGGVFTYDDIPASDVPSAGQTGTLTWTLGNITNTVNDGTDDVLVVRYRARVQHGATEDPAFTPTVASLSNRATLAYTYADGTPVPLDTSRMQYIASVEVRQPEITAISKTGAVQGPFDPATGGDGTSDLNAYRVDIVDNSMAFTLDACNDGDAPAYGVLITDTLARQFDAANLPALPAVSVYEQVAGPNTGVAAVHDFTAVPNAATGTTTFNFLLTDPLAPGYCARVEFNIGFLPDVAPNQTWYNEATVARYWSRETLDAADAREYTPVTSASVWMTNPATVEPPTKVLSAPANKEATIGQSVEYTITVPGTPVNAALTNVVVTDTLPDALAYEAGTVTAVDAGGVPVTLGETVLSPTEITWSIVQIPAGEQVFITLPVRVANNGSANNDGTPVANTASYTYEGIAGGSATDSSLTIVEPSVTVTKSVPATAVTAGELLTYTLTFEAAGSGGPGDNYASAEDLVIEDTLPLGLAYEPNSAFVGATQVEPAINAGGDGVTVPQTLTWDASHNIDVPEGGTVTVTYQVTVLDTVAPGQTLENSVTGRWTSLDGTSTYERTGADCPGGTPNDYCTSHTASVTTLDNTRLFKEVLRDDYVEANVLAESTGTDHILRVGDTVDYRLRLQLGDGTTPDVSVLDLLPAGLEFVSVISINGDTTGADGYTPPASGAGSNFAYDPITNVPGAGATGAVSWNFGSIVNDPAGDPTTDEFVIVYRARVVEYTLPHDPIVENDPAWTTNRATLSYTDGSGATVVDPARLESGADVTVWQPLMARLAKTDRNGLTSPAEITDVANTTMAFRLEACNDGAAPAYDLQISDTLASQFDESSINVVGVSVGGNLIAAGAGGYVYTYEPAGADPRTMVFDLDRPVYPTECVQIDYDIGFHTNFGANQTWDNTFTISEYWSLTGGAGQLYSPLTATPFVMTNTADVVPPSKILAPGQDGELAIGEPVVYQIAVPGQPRNAALHDVVISDPLDPNLGYESVTVTGVAGAVTNVTGTPGSEVVTVTIPQIPAGEQAFIELHARVRNVSGAQENTPVNNHVSYTYADAPGGLVIDSSLAADDAPELKIVEPLVSISKIVDPDTAPTVGDTLTYRVTLTSAGGVAGDEFADAFDITLTDTLGPGLEYVGNPTVTGAGNVIGAPDIIPGDGVNTSQTLVWGPGAAVPSDIDVLEGVANAVTVTYQVRVLDSVLANQILRNEAVAQWTGKDGDYSGFERDGSGGVNDYFTPTPAFVELQTLDNNAIAKTRVDDTWGAGDDNVRIGDTVDYELRISMQEGTLGNLVLTDTLPTGLEYLGIVSVNGNSVEPFGPQGQFVHDPIDATAVSFNGSEVTWTLGDVTNTPNDGNPDDFVIVYRARVLNNILPHADLDTELNNTVAMAYDTGSGRVTKSDIDTAIHAYQPSLSVTKSATTSINTGDGVVEAGEVVTYTVDITNGGTAPAYDPVLVDTLPPGLQQGGVTNTVITLVDSTGALVADPADVAPTTYTGGVATWDFNSIAYAIPPNHTLRVQYQVTGDPDLGAGLTLTNSALVDSYYSFSVGGVPANSQPDWREAYGPTTPFAVDLTTPMPGALKKVADQGTAAIGEQFSYTITVPETTVSTELRDVQIHDDLTAYADLRFVGAEIVGGATLTNSGSDTNVILGADGSIDVPADSQVEVRITVELLNTARNLAPDFQFVNAAWYSYDNGVERLGDETTTEGTSGAVTVVHPDLTVTKSGPASMRIGTPDNFVLQVVNTGDAPAWNVSLADRLPNPTPGGMCDTAPAVQSVVVNKADGTSVTLAASDYVANFTAGEPTCEFTVAMGTAASMLAPSESLTVTYRVALDEDNIHDTTLTNVAGATEWFSAGAGSAERYAYVQALTDGTPDITDYQDAHDTLVQGAILVSQKSVFNVTTGQSDGAASPGDTLRYTITVRNDSDVPLNGFTLIDELDRLNDAPRFQAGSLTNISAPAGADTSASNPNGGANGTGLLEVSGLDILANGTLTVEFEATLAPVISSGTQVENQGQLTLGGVVLNETDPEYPNLDGSQDPTVVVITSQPAFEVLKTSEDITDNAAELLAGETLRYSITVRNIGSEDAVNALLRDQVPANTTYVAGSTTLNGVPVADPSAGVSPLQEGMPINPPADTTAGAMPADYPADATNTATITFDVIVNSNVIEGTRISNQAFVSADGEGTSGPVDRRPSDDPDTTAVDDPTEDVVGSVPSVNAHKTVALVSDLNGNGNVDALDTLRYTISISNAGSEPATGVVFTDAVPDYTSYVAGSTQINGVPVSDTAAGGSPLAAGVDVSSSDLASPTAGNGTLSPGGSAVITFEVTVDDLTPMPAFISNQGSFSINEEPGSEPTDADGIESNGYQSTDIGVGAAQQLAIIKDVVAIDGTAEAGSTLEYRVRVTNIGTEAATQVRIADTIDTTVLTYVNGSAGMDRGPATIDDTTPTIIGDYSDPDGLAPGESVTLYFQAAIGADVPIGTLIANTAEVTWNNASQSAQASASIEVGGIPGEGVLNGRAWHDADYDRTFDAGETLLRGWTVELYQNGQVVGTQTTDDNGLYQFTGLRPNDPTVNPYELRFTAPNAGTSTAALGLGDSTFTQSQNGWTFTSGPQSIANIGVTSGGNLQNLNLPAQPNGVVYDSVQRTPVSGATLTMLSAATGSALPANCFDDAAQQGQVTATDGFYRFDLNFGDPSCPAGGDYIIDVVQPASGYVATPSRIIPPASNDATVAFSVPSCPGSADDADPSTANLCEAQPSPAAPGLNVEARSVGTRYYLHLTFSNGQIPGESQIFNNHIPVDPELDGAVAITKTSAKVNVSRGDLVPYTITVNNTLGILLQDLSIVDTFPAGFKYVRGSAQFDGEKLEPVINGRELRWDSLDLAGQEQHTIKLLFTVGAGVSEAEYVNRAQVVNTLSGQAVSGVATATVRVVPDPTFDCTDVIGKVFDDANRNGYQDEGEKGLPGARVVTARGLVVTSDEYGRFHITCAVVPNEDRGSNFILKLDDRSLPSGYRVTTENPRVQRATRGKMLKFNFGATIHRVVRLDIADGVFEPDSTEVRLQWLPRFELLMEELQKGPAILRISYLADVEDEGLVEDRIDAVKDRVEESWEKVNCCEELTIETEIFWRRGSPPDDLL